VDTGYPVFFVCVFFFLFWKKNKKICQPCLCGGVVLVAVWLWLVFLCVFYFSRSREPQHSGGGPWVPSPGHSRHMRSTPVCRSPLKNNKDNAPPHSHPLPKQNTTPPPQSAALTHLGSSKEHFNIKRFLVPTNTQYPKRAQLPTPQNQYRAGGVRRTRGVLQFLACL